ncbi:hypothetical protein [Rossellomorea yichunensis]|uniref:hypothetical protein n=1 Tax=Rossellomorea yichunensis TaxID=3077331 RepID=UPI0028DE8CDE|nr:hypothetical protein [Rossellomorea sp. YC4-1]MDT9027820.1 hypothetical protein [Rossellomorea sp. YC4-1]
MKRIQQLNQKAIVELEQAICNFMKSLFMFTQARSLRSDGFPREMNPYTFLIHLQDFLLRKSSICLDYWGYEWMSDSDDRSLDTYQEMKTLVDQMMELPKDLLSRDSLDQFLHYFEKKKKMMEENGLIDMEELDEDLLDEKDSPMLSQDVIPSKLNQHLNASTVDRSKRWLSPDIKFNPDQKSSDVPFESPEKTQKGIHLKIGSSKRFISLSSQEED